MNTPKHATDPEIDALFEILRDLEHDVFEQRRKSERPTEQVCTLATVEINKVVQNG